MMKLKLIFRKKLEAGEQKAISAAKQIFFICDSLKAYHLKKFLKVSL